jgi:mRNA interferase RelE/StbE
VGTVARVVRMANLPHPPSGIRRMALTGIEGYRLRVGDWRVVYTLKHEILTVVVIGVGHRREIYE